VNSDKSLGTLKPRRSCLKGVIIAAPLPPGSAAYALKSYLAPQSPSDLWGANAPSGGLKPH